MMGFTNRFLSYFGLSLILTVSIANAGGVSDGGGGTSHPDSADPEWIVGVALHDAAPVILTWLNQEESHFGRLSDAEKQKSPYRKIFQSDQSIYEVVRKTSIELRMNEPCSDINGAAKDGSIYANQPGTICISPFSMAPKLNEYTYQSETAALIFHEISHFMGTDEVEAMRLQREAIWAFNKFEMLDLMVNIDLLADGTTGGGVCDAMFGMGWWLQSPQSISRLDMAVFRERMLTLRDYKLHMGSSIDGPAMLRPAKFDLFTPQFSRLEVVEDFLCAVDPQESSGVRKSCNDRIEKAFQSDTVVTAKVYEERESGFSQEGPEWEQVTIQKPMNRADVAAILGQIRDYLLDVRKDIQLLKTFQFGGYRKT